MEQLERIRAMESILDEGNEVLEDLRAALERYTAIQKSLDDLTHYYEGPLWRQDYETDEAGRLPPDLKRGVLSEDAGYDLLSLRDELLARMKVLTDGL